MRKMGAQALWIDEFSPKYDVEISYEINHLKKILDGNAKINGYKFYFVKETPSEINEDDLSGLTFLSYSAVVNYTSISARSSYLLFSLVEVPKKYNLYKDKAVPLTNYYFHTIREYKFIFRNPGGKNALFKITCSPFFQKNDLTSFCIQTALATLLNQADYKDTLILPVHVNELAGLPESIAVEKGLDINQTQKVLKEKGYFSRIFDFHVANTDKLIKDLKNKFDLPPSGIIYPWMESGFPGFIVFVTKKDILHAVPIIGHTLNTDKWDPEADIRYRRNVRYHFRSVSAWVDNYIIHDDNFGMYLCYPTEKLEEKKKNYGYLVNSIIFMTRGRAMYQPDKIEIDLIATMRNLLDKFSGLKREENPWLYKLKHELNAPLVSRTVAINNSEFLKHLGSPDSFNITIFSKTRKYICSQLPDNFWLTEITLPDLYVANKTVLINFASDINDGMLLFIRFPKLCVIFSNEDSPEIIELNTLGHFRLYSLDHDTVTFDW